MKAITTVKVPTEGKILIKADNVEMPIEFSNENVDRNLLKFCINGDPSQTYAIDLLELIRIGQFFYQSLNIQQPR